MTEIGKALIIGGVLIAAIGAAIYLLGRAGFRGMPGDISYHTDHVRIYFPIVTCVVLSILLTVGWWLWRWLSGR